MLLENDALGAAELLHHERPAAERSLAEACWVLVYGLGWHDRPGRVGHVLEGRDEGTGQDDVEGVWIRRLKPSTLFRQEALGVALVRGGEGGAAADEALLAVGRGQLLVSGRATIRRRPDFDSRAEGEVEVGIDPEGVD